MTSLAGGSNVNDFKDGLGTVARFAFPRGLVVDQFGQLYVSDSQNHAIRKISPTGNDIVVGVGGGVGVGAMIAFSFHQVSMYFRIHPFYFMIATRLRIYFGRWSCRI